MTDPADDAVLSAVAAYGLTTTGTLPREALDGTEFTALLTGAERHRLLGLLAAAVGAGDLPVTAEQRAALDDELQAWLAHGLRLERLLLAAVDALSAAGLDHRVLKGIALAHTVYPDPAWRVFGDADVLVAPDALTASAEVLTRALGGSRDVPELRPGHDDRFGKEILLRCGPLELDLHRTFVEGALGMTVHLPDLWVPPGACDVGGRTLATFPPPQQLLHAAYAAVLGDWPPRFVARRDIAQVLTVHDPAPDEVLRLARDWRAEAVLARALTETWTALAPATSPALVEWARRYRAGRLERMLVASHTGAARAYTRHATALVVVSGLRARLAYLRAIVLPQRAWLLARGRTRRGFLARPVRLIRRSRDQRSMRRLGDHVVERRWGRTRGRLESGRGGAC